MNLKKSIRRILKEESEIPLYIRRRVDMNEIMTQFEESLESVSNLYIKKRDKLKSMNSQNILCRRKLWIFLEFLSIVLHRG
jgi:hypothetical protein